MFTAKVVKIINDTKEPKTKKGPKAQNENRNFKDKKPRTSGGFRSWTLVHYSFKTGVSQALKKWLWKGKTKIIR